MLKTTKWKPDTCGCVIEYEWDNELPDGEKTHTIKRVLEKCPAHTGATDAEVFNTVMNENTRKNLVYKELTKIPELMDGEELKKDVEYKWSYDENRDLQVELIGVDKTHSDSVKAAVSSLFGSKVKIK